jgi:two-component sensor histidine kinase
MADQTADPTPSPQPAGEAAELGRLRQHVRILGDLGRLAGISTDLDRFLDHAVLQVARAVEIEHVKILRYRPERGDLLIVAGVGWKPGVVGQAALSADLSSPPGRSFQTAEPIAIRNFTEQAEYRISPILREHGIVSLANAPVLIGGAAWGVLEVDGNRPRDFGHDTVDFLLAAGALIGSCVRRLGAETGHAESVAAAVLDTQYRETLLAEMQHRVKNSFQLILASITLQKRRAAVPEAGRALDRIAERIKAIALAHEQLSPSDTGQAINLAEYLRALCHTLRQQLDGIDIDIEIEADEILLAIDRAVSLGLIVNEAVTNAAKYAFGEGGGRIRVALAAGVGYGEARLSIADNGQGMPLAEGPAEAARPGGSGLRLIAALARKISAQVDQQSSPRGTTIAVQFPVIA